MDLRDIIYAIGNVPSVAVEPKKGRVAPSRYEPAVEAVPMVDGFTLEENSQTLQELHDLLSAV